MNGLELMEKSQGISEGTVYLVLFIAMFFSFLFTVLPFIYTVFILPIRLRKVKRLVLKIQEKLNKIENMIIKNSQADDCDVSVKR